MKRFNFANCGIGEDTPEEHINDPLHCLLGGERLVGEGLGIDDGFHNANDRKEEEAGIDRRTDEAFTLALLDEPAPHSDDLRSSELLDVRPGSRGVDLHIAEHGSTEF